MNTKRLENKRVLQRIVTFLDREGVDLLDKIEKDALFSSGFHLPRTKIIKALVDVLKNIRIDGKNIKSVEDFKGRVIRVLRLS